MAELPAVKTPCTHLEFCEAVVRGWRRLFGETPGLSSVLVLGAHWALETGHGKSMWCWNCGNAKASSKWCETRDWCFFRCNEVIGGKVVWFDPPHPQCRFRAFTSLDEGVVDYLGLLHQRFAGAWPEVMIGNPTGFAHRLKVQGYYTANEAQYTGTLVQVYNALARKLPVGWIPLLVESEPEGLSGVDRERIMGLVALTVAEMSRDALAPANTEPEGTA